MQVTRRAVVSFGIVIKQFRLTAFLVRRKTMNWYTIVKFLYIASVIVSVGGLFARQLIRAYAKTVSDIQSYATFMQAAGKIEKVMVIPGMMAIIIFGVILGLIGHMPILGFLQGAQQNWLLVANILLIIMHVIIFAVLVPRGKIFEPLLQDALTKGQITPELSVTMNDNAVKLAHLYKEVALIVITALMVLNRFSFWKGG
jgi:hypothetical protein